MRSYKRQLLPLVLPVVQNGCLEARRGNEYACEVFFGRDDQFKIEQ
jgi:hypothetical protein